MTGPPHRGPKPAGVAGLVSITVTPEHKGLLKDTVDFSQYKSDSPSRPARGGRTHLMILPRKKNNIMLSSNSHVTYAACCDKLSKLSEVKQRT